MIWLLATGLLALAAPIVLWPLLTHWEPEPEVDGERATAAAEARERALEEIELDHAAGRISEAEAARLRGEVAAAIGRAPRPRR